jgi:hypothetical protein
MLRAVPAWIKQPAPIVIAHAGNDASPAKYAEGIQHFDHGGVIVRRYLDLIQGSKYASVEKKIESIHMVVGRLLEVEAIGPNLLPGRFQYDLPPSFLPPPRFGKFRK